MYLLMTMLCLRCCEGFSLVGTSRGYSLLAVCGLLIAVASRGAHALGLVGISGCGTWA